MLACLAGLAGVRGVQWLKLHPFLCAQHKLGHRFQMNIKLTFQRPQQEGQQVRGATILGSFGEAPVCQLEPKFHLVTF